MNTIITVLLVILYFTPCYIAYGRNHNNAHAIAACNVLLGWSGIGFIVALIWSFTGNVKKDT